MLFPIPSTIEFQYNHLTKTSLAGLLVKRYCNAQKRYEVNTSYLSGLEATLLANGKPIDDWKKEEAEFIRDVMSPDARSKIIKSPYEPRIGKGQFILSLLVIYKGSDRNQHQQQHQPLKTF